MADSKRNALAELAKTLDIIASNTDTMFPNAINKASRIVAELAKLDRVDVRIARKIMTNYRDIAEEGATNGK